MPFRNLALALLLTTTSAWISGCGDSSYGDGDDDDGAGAGSSGPGAGPGAGATTGPGGDVLGEEHAGEYHLGPVEWEGSFWNACAPYPTTIQALEGELLAGVSNAVGADGSHCDACIQIDTAQGKTVIARVVTYGETAAPGNIDVSQAAYDLLNQGEYPRTMTWRLVSCPGGGPLHYQFQTGANPYWTSLWVRNPRIAIDRVEVKSANHADYFALQRGPDGTFTDAGGFGEGAFTIRVVGVDGSSVEEQFDGFDPGETVEGSKNL